MFLIWQVCSLQQRRRHHRQEITQEDGTNTNEADENVNNINNEAETHAAAATANNHNNHNHNTNRTQTGAMASTSSSSSSSSDRDATLITLNVKYRHVSSTVQVSTDQSVADLKSTVLQTFQLLPTKQTNGETLNKNPSSSSSSSLGFGNYRLIYCGCPLNEDTLLQDLNLANESHLHVIKIDPHDTLRLSSNGVPGVTLSDYFIYCPSRTCRTIQPSKLRTKCSECSSLTSFLIDRDRQPSCREDVLSCSTVHGHCSNTNCKSTKAKFIFQCRQDHPFADSVPLKHIRNNARRIVCITCEDIHTPVIVFPCDRQHTMCLNCFKIYSVICLNERRFQQTDKHGYTLPCPAHCPDSHIQEAHHFHVLERDEYERYKNFGTEEYVLQNGGVLCPRPTCGQGMIPESTGNTIHCFTCKHHFCRLCSCDSHVGPCGRQQPMESCEQSMLHSTDVLKKCQWENQSQNLIDQISKPCPKCKVKTEKDGGCNHMHCRCDEEWCWICVKTWSRDCMEAHWLD